jgi:hypothetical protein
MATPECFVRAGSNNFYGVVGRNRQGDYLLRPAELVGDLLQLTASRVEYPIPEAEFKVSYRTVAGSSGALLEDNAPSKQLDPEGAWPPEPGDRVLLRSGGMQMTVHTCTENVAYCWWHNADGDLCVREIPLACLQRAPRATSQ